MVAAMKSNHPNCASMAVSQIDTHNTYCACVITLLDILLMRSHSSPLRATFLIPNCTQGCGQMYVANPHYLVKNNVLLTLFSRSTKV